MRLSRGRRSSLARTDQRGAMKRWLPVVGVVGVLAIAWFASLYSSTDVTQLPPLPANSSSVKPPDGDPAIKGPSVPFVGVGVPSWLLWLIVVPVLLFIAVLVIALIWT